MKRIVIKVGTNLLTQEDGQLDRNNLVQIISQISTIKQNNNIDIIIVSSGAIASGRQLLNSIGVSIPEKQACASVGQILLMSEYRAFFKEHHFNIGQILLTKNELTDTDDRNNIKNTIHTLFKHNIIPIVNANDSVSTLQIESGDNDELSVLLSILLKADSLIILTNTEGLYTDHPSLNSSATLIPIVNNITSDILELAKGPENSKSKGGMKAKVTAANLATKNGIDVYIANGRSESSLIDIFDKKQVGTYFPKMEN